MRILYAGIDLHSNNNHIGILPVRGTVYLSSNRMTAIKYTVPRTTNYPRTIYLELSEPYVQSLHFLILRRQKGELRIGYESSKAHLSSLTLSFT